MRDVATKADMEAVFNRVERRLVILTGSMVLLFVLATLALR